MNSDEIRQKFTEYFVKNGHIHLPGLPLVTNDPSVTTMFTIAGMQQMIPYFLGREQPPGPNMVTVQRSVRTNDIDEVGDDIHLTFLEMLGNFSVGAYFKRQAIAYTWEFLTSTMGIPAERWWAVTYPGDEEARDGWFAVGMPPERIGETVTNWWGPPGEYGPCGPNSEIHYDRGIAFGCGAEDCRPESECCERFVEIWNDVFMSFYQDESGERRPLPWNNIDTGMGFERLVTVKQDVRSVYDTDLFQPIIASITRLTQKTYGHSDSEDRSLRIISDHVRAASFVIAEGVMPSSAKRGYVLRRLIRRAALHGQLLGLTEPFLTTPAKIVIESLGGFYPELRGRSAHILEVLHEEEKRFLQTLSRGLSILDEVADRAKSTGGIISGEDAFALYDTHGFPLELTEELARERHLTVDRGGYDTALEAQRQRGRRGTSGRSIGTSPETYVSVAETVQPTSFTGYDELSTTTSVAAILQGSESVNRIAAGDEAELVLSATPFYAESGGQVGDTGYVRGDAGIARVEDTQRPFSSLVVHRVVVQDGDISVGDIVDAEVETERRLHILPHHSGTHLLHKALQEVLGREATQAGSLVAPDRLRFDFRWPRALSQDELREVQDRVNAAIWANLPVRKEIMPYAEAVADGATALFGEKYGDQVRVVSMGDWSKELCGGTHVDATGDIGSLVITEERSIGSGVRRIEAVAGAAAYAYVDDLRTQLSAISTALESKPENAVLRAEQLVRQHREQERRLEALSRQLAARDAEALLRSAETFDGLTVVSQPIFADSVDYLQVAIDAVRSRMDRGVVVLGALVESKPAFAMGVTKGLTDEGYQANTILKQAAREAQGGAGGTSEFAQGGGRDASKLQDVLTAALDLVKLKAGS